MKRFWIKKGAMIGAFFIAAVLVFSAVVMALWNSILPAVVGVNPISYLQAIGLLVLSKILFGGFHGRGFRGRNGGPMWNQKLKDKWTTMSPEEREQFKSEWKNRCGGWKMRTGPSTGGASLNSEQSG